MNYAPEIEKTAATRRGSVHEHLAEFQALGLVGCIDRLAEPLRAKGVELRWEMPRHRFDITAVSAELLYRAAEEILGNAAKYSAATAVTIRLSAVFHGLRLGISDNGVGFDAHRSFPGSGLAMMRSAVQAAGGNTLIDSAPGAGTRVTVTVPLD
jgi:two-component system, NarL family, sensor histidine kinase UhpB